MKSKYRVGSRVSVDGFKGTIINIKETYKRNVIVVKVSKKSNRNKFKKSSVNTISLLEDEHGILQFMTVVE